MPSPEIESSSWRAEEVPEHQAFRTEPERGTGLRSALRGVLWQEAIWTPQAGHSSFGAWLTRRLRLGITRLAGGDTNRGGYRHLLRRLHLVHLLRAPLDRERQS